MKEGDALRAVFEAAGADVSKRTITTCGSGVTAAILMLALERLGNKTCRSTTGHGPNGASSSS
jgi:thiosulfate/3-mercaptopyruvate sulfurtransferase